MNASAELLTPHAGNAKDSSVISGWHRLDGVLYEMALRALACAGLLMLSACQAQSPKHTPEELASHKAWVKGSAECQKLANQGDDVGAHNCLVDLPEDLTAAKPRYTAEQRASHYAARKVEAVCSQMKDLVDRVICYQDVPADYTWVDPDGMDSAPISGIDHLVEHLSVQEFSVDGVPGGRAGQGGSEMCCVKLPNRWRPNYTVEVRWNVTNWRDCTGEEHARRVPFEPYTSASSIHVHFLANGEVKIVSSSSQPGIPGRPNPNYPVKDPIPDKDPWHKYPLDETCKKKEAKARAAKDAS